MAGAESFVLKAERFLTEECVGVGGRNRVVELSSETKKAFKMSLEHAIAAKAT